MNWNTISPQSKALFVGGLVLIAANEIIQKTYGVYNLLGVTGGLLVLLFYGYIINCMVKGNCTWFAWFYVSLMLFAMLIYATANSYIQRNLMTVQKKKT